MERFPEREKGTRKDIATNMANGMDEKSAAKAAEKQAIEDARFVLPNACTTKIMMTMNARSLHNFFRHRCCNRAQWEIRELAEHIYDLDCEVYANLGSSLGRVFNRNREKCVDELVELLKSDDYTLISRVEPK